MRIAEGYSACIRTSNSLHDGLYQVSVALNEMGIPNVYSIGSGEQSIRVRPEDEHIAEWVADRVEQGSATWDYVLRFAAIMEYKLSQNRHKGDRAGWMRDQPWDLYHLINDEVTEVFEALTNYSINPTVENARALALECADVANTALMLCDRVGGL